MKLLVVVGVLARLLTLAASIPVDGSPNLEPPGAVTAGLTSSVKGKCTPGLKQCAINGVTLLLCNNDGVYEAFKECPACCRYGQHGYADCYDKCDSSNASSLTSRAASNITTEVSPVGSVVISPGNSAEVSVSERYCPYPCKCAGCYPVWTAVGQYCRCGPEALDRPFPNELASTGEGKRDHHGVLNVSGDDNQAIDTDRTRNSAPAGKLRGPDDDQLISSREDEGSKKCIPGRYMCSQSLNGVLVCDASAIWTESSYCGPNCCVSTGSGTAFCDCRQHEILPAQVPTSLDATETPVFVVSSDKSIMEPSTTSKENNKVSQRDNTSVTPQANTQWDCTPGTTACKQYGPPGNPSDSRLAFCDVSGSWVDGPYCGAVQCCQFIYQSAYCVCGPQGEGDQSTGTSATISDRELVSDRKIEQQCIPGQAGCSYDGRNEAHDSTLSVRTKYEEEYAKVRRDDAKMPCTPGTSLCGWDGKSIFNCDLDGRPRFSATCGETDCCEEGATPGTAFCVHCDAHPRT